MGLGDAVFRFLQLGLGFLEVSLPGALQGFLAEVPGLPGGDDDRLIKNATTKNSVLCSASAPAGITPPAVNRSVVPKWQIK